MFYLETPCMLTKMVILSFLIWTRSGINKTQSKKSKKKEQKKKSIEKKITGRVDIGTTRKDYYRYRILIFSYFLFIVHQHL